MKYIYATIYSITSLFMMTLIVTGNPYQTSPTFGGVIEIVGVSALVFAGTVLAMNWFAGQSQQILQTEFQIIRALRVKGSEEGIPQVDYYLELNGGGILFFASEQPLNVYALPKGHNGKSGLLFPNNHFAVLRDADTGTMLGLAIHGEYVPPEELDISDEATYLKGKFMRNEEVNRDVSYEDLKRRLMGE